MAYADQIQRILGFSRQRTAGRGRTSLLPIELNRHPAVLANTGIVSHETQAALPNEKVPGAQLPLSTIDESPGPMETDPNADYPGYVPGFGENLISPKTMMAMAFNPAMAGKTLMGLGAKTANASLGKLFGGSKNISLSTLIADKLFGVYRGKDPGNYFDLPNSEGRYSDLYGLGFGMRIDPLTGERVTTSVHEENAGAQTGGYSDQLGFGYRADPFTGDRVNTSDLADLNAADDWGDGYNADQAMDDAFGFGDYGSDVGGGGGWGGDFGGSLDDW